MDKLAKIIFERSSGLLLGQTINNTLDLDSLPASESEHLIHLIQEADFFHIPENLTSQSAADEVFYSITVEAGATRHRVRVSNTSVPEPLMPLVNELAAIAAIS
jgi:Emfourin